MAANATTACTRCVHKDVCAYKSDYLNILKAVENARVTVFKEDPDGGEITSKSVTDYDFISGVSVGCRYYRNWTDTRAQKETGVILLPSYLEAQIVPEDIEIRLVNGNGECVLIPTKN